MTQTNTPLLQLNKDDDQEEFVQAWGRLQSNLDKLDVAGTVICTSDTRPTTGLVNGVQIYETDTGKVYRRSNGVWELHSSGNRGVSRIAGLRGTNNSGGITTEEQICPRLFITLTETRRLEFRANPLVQFDNVSGRGEVTLRFAPGITGNPDLNSQRVGGARATGNVVNSNATASLFLDDVFAPGTYAFRLFLRSVDGNPVRLIASVTAPLVWSIYDAGAS